MAGILYTALFRLARASIHAYFRRVRVIHRGRFPRTGATLLVANHPSAWADAGVLLGAFGRKLHFLVQGEQYHPWPRGLLLRLFGALPVFSRASGDPAAAAKNADTFRRCEALFEQGEVVAVFPVGVSLTDRTLMPLRLGAARLAISHVRNGGRAPLALVAVGLHYSDRVAMRSDVTVNVGEATAPADLGLLASGDPEQAASRLTEIIAREIRALALGAIRPRQAAALASLEPIAERVAEDLELDDPVEALASSLDRLEHVNPGAFRRIALRALAQDRLRRALGVSGVAFAPHPRRARGARGMAAAAFAAAGALPAAAGALIHAIPAALTELARRWFATAPSHVAFVRIAAGAIYFLGYYAGMAWLLFFHWRLTPVAGGAVLLLSAGLGACAFAYAHRVRASIGRLRLDRIALRHPGLVVRARTEEEWLRRRVKALLTPVLEASDVDPAHPTVLELGARTSALPR